MSLTEAFIAANEEYPEAAQSQGIVYHPVLVAQASTRFINRTYQLDYDQKNTALVGEPDRRGMVRWDDFHSPPLGDRQFDPKPVPQAKFSGLEAPLSDPKLVKAIEKDFIEWVFRSSEVIVRVNEALKVCQRLVLCVSPEALDSKYVKDEYRFFIHHEKTIFPVILKKAEMPMELLQLQSIPFAQLGDLIERLRDAGCAER